MNGSPAFSCRGQATAIYGCKATGNRPSQAGVGDRRTGYPEVGLTTAKLIITGWTRSEIPVRDVRQNLVRIGVIAGQIAQFKIHHWKDREGSVA